MMERLHAAAVYLFRFGGMHPFKTKQYLNQMKVDVWLLLWAVFLPLMNTLLSVYYLVKFPKLTSLDILLPWLFNVFWAVETILIPIHFICHAKEIAAVNKRVNNIIGIFCINSRKFSIKSKLTILAFVIMQIIKGSLFVIDICDNCSEAGTDVVSILTSTFLNGYWFFIDLISTFSFVIYLSILAECFSHYDACLEGLFDGSRSEVELFLGRPVSTVSALYPLAVYKSIYPQQSVERKETTNKFDDDPKPIEQFTKSLRIRTKHVSTQTCVDTNMQDFFQNLEDLHVSIFEDYKIYELCTCIFGFPLLLMTIHQGILCCTLLHKLLKLYTLEDTCSVLLLINPITMLLMNILLTTLPHTLDENVSNSH